MRDRLTFTILILASVVSGSAGRAQERPDFSGTWSLPPDAPLARNGKPAPAPGFGPTINILQDARRVTIARLMGGTTVHVVHPLDGSETRSRTPGRLCQGDSESVWTASWQGSDILTTLVGALPAGASAATKMDVKTVFRLQGPETMAVEITFRNPGMTAPQTRTTIYKKTGPPAAIPEPDVAPLQAGISQVGWLGGTWVGTSGTTMVEERWTPAAGGSMLAISRTIRNGVMNGFEFLCVVERNGGLTYQAMPNGRQPATDFRLTAMGPNSLTFENPAHDFPKMVRYRLGPDGTLEAVVSGSEQQKLLTFRFRKQNPQ
jgi:hypothetical protein